MRCFPVFCLVLLTSCFVLHAADDVSSPHPDGWTWDELARRAGERADKAKIESLRAIAKRQSVEESLAWKDPQLRLGHTWTDSRDKAYDRAWDALPMRPENGDGETWTAGVRFYISNPFVNRQLRRRGDAQVESLEACARAEAYAVYCEVKSLCLDEEFARRETEFRAEELALLARLRDLAERQLAGGVAKSPLDAVQAEIARERAGLRLSEAEEARARARGQIAFLTGLPESSLKIRYTPPVPPSTNAALAEVLVETAFARRPDLAGALADWEAAHAGVDAAKAAYIPWFDFGEGTYSHQTSSSDDWGSEKISGYRSATRGHKSGREDDWQVRVALSVPLFTWMGDSVKRSRLVLDMADVRVQALRAAIANEIGVATEAFRRADARFVRLSDDGGAFQKKMEARLADYARESGVRAEDLDRTRLAMVGYRRVRAQATCDWVRSVLLLESVSGGELPRIPVNAAKVPPKKTVSAPSANRNTAPVKSAPAGGGSLLQNLFDEGRSSAN